LEKTSLRSCLRCLLVSIRQQVPAGIPLRAFPLPVTLDYDRHGTIGPVELGKILAIAIVLSPGRPVL
jgi:hypothetical protein